MLCDNSYKYDSVLRFACEKTSSSFASFILAPFRNIFMKHFYEHEAYAWIDKTCYCDNNTYWLHYALYLIYLNVVDE